MAGEEEERRTCFVGLEEEGGKTAEEEEEEGAQIKSGLACGIERQRCCCLLRALQGAGVAPRFSREEGGRRVRKRGEGKKQPG